MEHFNLSSSQKMLLFSEINNENNTSFYLKFRKDYDLTEINHVKEAIEYITKKYLNLQITVDANGDYKQHYVNQNVDIECFDISNESLDAFIEEYLDNPFDNLIDSPMYKWAVLKTEDKAVLIGVVQHILLDGTSLFSIIPKEIDRYITCLKNNDKYTPIDFSYEDYVNKEAEYLKSTEAIEDKNYWLKRLEDYNQDWYSFELESFESKEIIIDEIPTFEYSPFITALTLNFLYLSKSKKENKIFKDIVLNTSVHGRYFGQIDALGMFTNTIPLRLKYDENLTFEELLSYCKAVLKEGLSHAKLQFSEYTTDLRNHNISPNCISMFSMVSNSTEYDSKFLTLQKDIEFPLHFRINKNYSDKNGLQSIFIEYSNDCFTEEDINAMSNGILSLLKEVSDNPYKKCADYNVDIIDFFEAENYYNNLINSFDESTMISPDVNLDKSGYNSITQSIDEDKLKYISNHHNISEENTLLAIFLFNLTKFAFSKDILISYNNAAAGYHFNSDMSIEEYLNDFNETQKEYPNYPLANNQKLKFESEILFSSTDYPDNKHKLIFNHENGKIRVKYDTSYYSKELIEAFLDGMNILIDKFNCENNLLKDLSIAKKIDLDEDFKIELANEGIINKIFENAVQENPDKIILYAEDGQLTYNELNIKANKIANSLIEKGVGVEDKVMFMMRRNSDLIATVLGIIKAGAAFIPIDPKYPQKRIDQILEDSDSKFVITSSDIEYDGKNRIDVSELLSNSNDNNPHIELDPENLAFLIYTSGST
ncbi:MAG: condensation domain-containing protein, partial [Methanosphaera sp.]|nr:condensation domain-containing protein [Methanosphaera sp.]